MHLLSQEHTHHGNSPLPVDASFYFTKEETQELLAQNLAESKNYTDEQIESIDLSQYATDDDLQVVSGAVDDNTASISTIETDLATKASQADLTAVEAKADTNSGNIQTLSGEVDSLAQDITGKADKADVDIISGKVDGHIADTEIHTTALEKAAWDAKQTAITADNKLDYALLSGTPAIPTKTSDLTNDSGFATSGYVDDGLALKQDIIDESNPISGNAVLVTYDPWTGDPEFTAEAAINMAHSEALQAQADATQANADIQIVSGVVDTKLEAPSGGTAGQVLTKTADGAEWADAQSGNDSTDYFYVQLNSSGIRETQSFRINKTGDTSTLNSRLEYSFDKENWTEYTWDGNTGAEITLIKDPDIAVNRNPVYLRAVDYNPNGMGHGNYSYGYYQFTLTRGTLQQYSYTIGGNIMSLVSKNLTILENLPSYCFTRLFKDCNALSKVNDIFKGNQIAIGQACDSMFQNCVLLKSIVIPWISYSNSYRYMPFRNMFNGCSNLNDVVIENRTFIFGTATENWLSNVAASGTFYCPYGLDTSIRDESHIPAGWNVVYTSVPEEVVNQAAAVENLIMNND